MRRFLLLLALWISPPLGWASPPVHLVVLSDPHLPGRHVQSKRDTLNTVDSWDDVAGVAVVGDLCENAGTPQELEFSREFFSALKKPLFPVTGNHDYIYDVSGGSVAVRVRASPEVRRRKLAAFKKAFALPDLHYTKTLEGYLLVFVSVDDLKARELATLSPKTLKWLKRTLSRDKKTPTLIFFHAPLEGTLLTRNVGAETPSFTAQPARAIRDLLKENPQVFLWVSGHMHVAPPNAWYRGRLNLYDGRVTNIHNPDMDGRSYLSADDRDVTLHDTVWSNSLYLYPDKVEVKTYDHKADRWLDDLTLDVPRPKIP